MYYDTTTETYIPVDSTSGTVAAATPAAPEVTSSPQQPPPPPPPPAPTDKPANQLAFMPPVPGASSQTKPKEQEMSAKKLAKEMEKWAKGQNLQSSQKQTQRVVARPIQPTIAAFEVYDGEDKVIKSLPGGPSIPSSLPANEPIVPEIDPFEIIAEEEAKMIDKGKLACLLCKRQFSTDLQLQKHIDVSDLHKVSD